jgi:pyruvate dehydrogenase kinase 2/3/4
MSAISQPTHEPWDSEQLRKDIETFARRPVTRSSLNAMWDFGTEWTPELFLTASKFLYCELPIRVAHMAKELEKLPGSLSDMPSVRRVHNWYLQSFADLRACPYPKTGEDLARFCELIDMIKRRHARVVETIADGIIELKQRKGPDAMNLRVQDVLDRFYTQRIGIRILIGQHVALNTHRPGWVGIIDGHAQPAAIAREATHHASMLCRRTYGTAPKVDILGKSDLEFRYIPSHIYHMLLELLKNSMRATVEAHQAGGGAMPHVRVILADGHDDISVKVSDEGGGIPRSGMAHIWTYLYTTAKRPSGGAPYDGELEPIAGYGCGLPLTRLYARIFGGDLEIHSMDGWGTDAYLHLSKLGTDREPLV